MAGGYSIVVLVLPNMVDVTGPNELVTVFALNPSRVQVITMSE